MNLLQLDTTLGQITNSVRSYGVDLSFTPGLLGERIEEIKGHMSETALNEIYNSLNIYSEIIKNEEEEISDLGILESNKLHLVAFLSRYGLKADEQFLTDFDKEHIIEVYAKNHQQIFRSVNFFSLSSYSLEALTFLPWDELFHRKEEDFTKLFNLANYVLENSLRIMTPKKMDHILTEVESEAKFRHSVFKVGCVYDDEDVPMGYITLIKVKKINNNLKLLQ